MKYLGKHVNGKPTRDKVIRSMDIANAKNADEAIENYKRVWFSSARKQYLNEALKETASGAMFWPMSCITDMLDEIYVNAPDEDIAEMAKDIDLIKSAYSEWARSRKSRNAEPSAKLRDIIKDFEKKYSYACPDTFMTAWMNTGAFITLCYAVKYDGLTIPGCTDINGSLSRLKAIAMQIISESDIAVDERLLRLCYAAYASKIATA